MFHRLASRKERTLARLSQLVLRKNPLRQRKYDGYDWSVNLVWREILQQDRIYRMGENTCETEKGKKIIK